MTGVCFIGVDPGKTGGIAFLSESDGIILTPMPVNDDGIDVVKLTSLLRGYAPDTRVAFLEHVSGAPVQGRNQGTWSMFNFGHNFGIVRGVLAGVGIDTVLVRPQTWMKATHFKFQGSDTKERSRAAFKSIFPGVNALATERSRVEHEGMIEAALIADYGRRVTRGIF